MNDACQAVERLASALALLNPSAVLDRGYAIVTSHDGHLVSDARELRVGDDVGLTLATGQARATVTSTGASENQATDVIDRAHGHRRAASTP